MAQIDSRIALGFQPQTQLENPVNQLAKILQVQNMQMQNEAGRYDMELKRSDREQNNKLMQFLATNPDLSTPEGRRGLYEAAPLKADGILKSRSETAKAGTDAEAATFKLANDRYTAYKKTLGALSADPMLTKEKVIQAGQELVSAGILPAAMLQNAIGNLPDDPEAIRASLRQGLASQLTPEQVFTVFSPKPEKIDNGQQIITRDMNPNSPTYGQNTGGAPVQKQMTPGEVASNKIAQGNLAVAQGNLAVSRDRLNFDKAAPKGVLDPERGLLVDPRTGEARPVTMGGKPVGSKQGSEVKKELLSINQQRSAIDGAIDAVRKTPSAFSLGRGLAGTTQIGESLAGRTESKDETVARGYVFNNVSRIINERAGAAQSAQELARLNSFLPAPTDNAEQIVNKLEGFKQYLADMERGTVGGQASPAQTPTAGGFKILSVE